MLLSILGTEPNVQTSVAHLNLTWQQPTVAYQQAIQYACCGLAKQTQKLETHHKCYQSKHATAGKSDTTCRRNSYRPDLIKWGDIEPEAVTGKQFRLNVKDKQGRAVLVMRPR